MTDTTQVTLMEAARLYLAELADGERSAGQAEVQRFIRWYGADRPCGQLRGHDVANYAETLTGSVTDAPRRAEAVKKFLSFAKKAGYTTTNLGTHLRLRKTTASRPAKRGPALQEVQLSEQEKEALTAELESLKAQRPGIAQDLKLAMEDKDFKENAPLDAARDHQGHVEGRIRRLEATLQQAVVVQDDPAPSGQEVEIGSTVVLRNLESGAETTYTLVRPGEVDAAQGRISFQSPMGQALLLHRAGDEVDVAAPSGTRRFRIESVEG
ncbi:MAG: transcription elongation factor GreA [Dehalococcoidia bacterium]